MRIRALTACLLLLAGAALAAPEDSAARVRRAALATYVHGMTDDIAAREVGVDGIPHLIQLLREPTFPRRDNVVAFLAHLADDAATAALIDYLDQPVALRFTPEEDRAQLLVPQALGRIAARGGETAQAALQRMSRSSELSPELAAQVRYGIKLSAGAVEDGSPETADRGAESRAPDNASTGHDSALSFANHVSVPDPMTDSRLDEILDFASTAVGEVDFSEDVGCCVRVSRSGSAGSFGQPGDGLDIIDDNLELQAVAQLSLARVKVVRLINYCGGPGSNIVGCAYKPGDAMIVVRTSSNEGLLWLHEYGHNVGLDHNDDSRYVMYGMLSSGVRALTTPECTAYHFPHPQSGMVPTVLGSCHDDDADDLASTADNCPDQYNPDQADADGDGRGDLCDGCVDLDADGFGSPADAACPEGMVADCDDSDPDIRPGALDYCDGADNDCDGGPDNGSCDQFEATGDQTVDGVEVAWLGWAFGRCSNGPPAEWWLGMDFTQDGCVDGDDLAILSTVYRCSGALPVCE